MSVVSLTTLLTICFLSTPDSRQVDLSAGARGPVNGVATSSSPAPRHWMTSYEEARVIAVRNKLPLLLHFDAPWCGACRRMETEVLNRSEVTAMLGTAVVGVRVNADHNKDLIAEFGISTLPTEVVVFADGTRGSRYTGAQDLTAYVARLNSISGQNQQTIAES
ncbi:MAG: thioredoxin family protein, partial [Planctomycetaceae bacterium]|nr:thioredoxin family protein [Planctomycetaceae bacterium]